jgi:hypothetical protein
MEGTEVGSDTERKITTYTLNMILKDAGYGFAMLDVFFRYDRQVANLIAVVGYKVLE